MTFMYWKQFLTLSTWDAISQYMKWHFVELEVAFHSFGNASIFWVSCHLCMRCISYFSWNSCNYDKKCRLIHLEMYFIFFQNAIFQILQISCFKNYISHCVLLTALVIPSGTLRTYYKYIEGWMTKPLMWYLRVSYLILKVSFWYWSQ